MKARWWLVGTLLGLGITLSLAAYFAGPRGQAQRIGYARGQSLSELADTLKARGVIESPALFLLFVKASGKQERIKAGYYEFRQGDHEWRAASTLLRGPIASLEVRVTLPEGLPARDMAGLLHRKAGVDSGGFMRLVRDRKFIDSLAEKFPYLKGVKSLEGFLFPDTYFFYKNEKPGRVITVMIQRHFALWNRERLSRAEDLKMTVPQVVTLASIVECEAQVDSERAIIASVFMNRLARGMPLASNSTLGYVLKKNPGWLTEKDLSLNSPYNTYKRKGLPPTPICSPGTASIDAVLYPKSTDYLYFVATGGGGHLFARSYPEHQRNVRRVRARWKK